MALELETLQKERSRKLRERVQRLRIECQGLLTRIEVHVDSGRALHTLADHSSLALNDRARATALAAAELIDELSVESTTPSTPKADAQPAPAPSSATTAPRTASDPTLLRMSAAARLHYLGQPGAWLYGAIIEPQLSLNRLFSLNVDLGFALGTRGLTHSDIRVLTASSAAKLLAASMDGAIAWGIGPGFRFGYASLSATPKPSTALQGETLDGIWAGPCFHGSVWLPLSQSDTPSRGPWLGLSMEAGFVALPLTGTLDGHEKVYTIGGSWFFTSVHFGVPISLGR
jgi:hypothetical protein